MIVDDCVSDWLRCWVPPVYSGCGRPSVYHMSATVVATIGVSDPLFYAESSKDATAGTLLWMMAAL